jgi:hypothetical protein
MDIYSCVSTIFSPQNFNFGKKSLTNTEEKLKEIKKEKNHLSHLLSIRRPFTTSSE